MGNRCFKKKEKPIIDEDSYIELNQITIEKVGTCDICDKQYVEGYLVQSVVKTMSIFVCKECKNLK